MSSWSQSSQGVPSHNRTIYRWKIGQHTRSTTWTNTVRNRFHQKAGKIEADMEVWWEKQDLLPYFKKKDRMGMPYFKKEGQNEYWRILLAAPKRDNFSNPFTSDWYLRKGESRDKMGEWMKKTTVRSQDQRRMLQTNTHSREVPIELLAT